MTRARALKFDRSPPAEPTGGDLPIRRPSALDECPDPAARAILECGLVLGYGTAAGLAAGRFKVGLTWRDGVLRVFDGAGRLTAVCASWRAASVAALVAMAEAEQDAADG